MTSSKKILCCDGSATRTKNATTSIEPLVDFQSIYMVQRRMEVFIGTSGFGALNRPTGASHQLAS